MYLQFILSASIIWTRGWTLNLTADRKLSIDSIARTAARRAGDLILLGSNKVNLRTDITSKIGSRDIVTEYDKNCQNVIKDVIRSEFPSHEFLGEEDVEPGIDASTAICNQMYNKDHLWIVDPIDGTTNFAHGMPLSGVIIGYASNGVLQYGCIFDPFRNEIFTAWKGGGAYLNDARIHVCETPDLKSSVVCTGSPPNIDALDGCLRATNLLSPQVRTVRMLGSAAIMFAWVACGRLTSYFETDLNVWDSAAGALLVQEAGGQVTDVWGDVYSLQTRNIVSSNSLIHRSLLSKLQDARMWMPSDSNKILNV